MIVLKQNKLSQLCYNISNAENNYLDYIQYGIIDVTNWFNEYWISNFSKRIAYDIEYYLRQYTTEVTEEFYQLNKKVKREVRHYNENPENLHKLHYSGFSISKPYNLSLFSKLNDTLFDNKIGSLNKETNMKYPIKRLIIAIEDASNALVVGIVKSDALRGSDSSSVQQKIKYLERKIINSLNEILEIIIDKEM